MDRKILQSAALLVLIFWASYGLHHNRSGALDLGQPLQTFSLSDSFGVSSPSQVVSFALNPSVSNVDPASVHLVDQDGREVPFQILSTHQIAVQTDLPAHAQKQWRLLAGAPSNPVQAVRVAEKAGYYELDNGLIGARITASYATPPASVPAPLLDVRYQDGTWVSGANPLPGTGVLSSSVISTREWDLNDNLRPTSIQTAFLEKGPLKTVLKVTYTFPNDHTHGDWYYKAGVVVQPKKPMVTDDTYFYTSTIEMDAGSPTLMLEEDADLNVAYSLDFTKGLAPDTAMYRGHHSESVELGHAVDGSRYGSAPEQPGTQMAYIDLKSQFLYPLSFYNPWAVNSGWLEQFYDGKSGASDNLLGIFAGPPSRLIGMSVMQAGVWPVAQVDGNGNHSLALWMSMYPHPESSTLPRHRFSWGIFLGKKSADLKAGDQGPMSIDREMNVHSGLNLTKLAGYHLDSPPPAGYVHPFLSSKAIQEIRQQFQKGGPYADQVRSRYYGNFYDLINLWKDPSPANLSPIADPIVARASSFLDYLVNQRGSYEPSICNFMGAQYVLAATQMADEVRGDPGLTSDQAQKVEKAMALFADIIWDRDYIPTPEDPLGAATSGAATGTYNMASPVWSTRFYLALDLPGNPDMQGHLAQVKQWLPELVGYDLTDEGITHQSPHYTASAVQGTVDVLLEAKQAGLADYFKDDPRLVKFADFYLNFLTPVEKRLGNIRATVEFGDGATETNPLYAILANGMADGNPDLAKQLQWVWKAQGQPQYDLMGPSLIKIDPGLPDGPPYLKDAQFPGYYSVLRNGFGTADETALWMIIGGQYWDHRKDEYGSAVLYALGAPISLGWDLTYNPRIDSGYLLNTVTPESYLNQILNQRWDQENPPLQRGTSAWSSGTPGTLESFPESSRTETVSAGAAGGTWTRAVTSIHANPDLPIIVYHDNFDSDTSQILNLNFMSQGPISTPIGKVEPEKRSWDMGINEGTVSAENEPLPSATEPINLPAGLATFGFTGQQGVDWDVVEVSPGNQQAVFSSYGAQYKGASYQQQQILHLKGTKGFETVILPYRAGEKPANRTIGKSGSDIVVSDGSEITTIGATYYAYQKAGTRILASFDAAPAQGADGLSISGGAAEVSLSAGQATVVLSGGPGERVISLPANLNPVAGSPIDIKLKDGLWHMSYGGGDPVTLGFALTPATWQPPSQAGTPATIPPASQPTVPALSRDPAAQMQEEFRSNAPSPAPVVFHPPAAPAEGATPGAKPVPTPAPKAFPGSVALSSPFPSLPAAPPPPQAKRPAWLDLWSHVFSVLLQNAQENLDKLF